MVRVLFVCSGNICRSPMAEGVFQHMVDEAGLGDKITVDSAGTGSWHVGESADRRTRRELSKHGISYSGRSRQLNRGDFDKFDYILAMDHSNLRNIQAKAPRSTQAHIQMLLDYAPSLGTREVPDPYYDGGFDYVYDLVHATAEGLLAHIRQEHGL
jgi:protein-tyrosine phosphatase